ncbi:TetR/AcrR family transcriptional regulator [Nocardia canadensis]|uniref:TetR/AcrR family transcriptional regulator n=1 Tax=Nocardia canadensis TaxID=3065238 RepID=UPI00292E0E38|nr:helix-turn-helix domain-containing protein [Nocardia canadensis]
MCPPRDALVPIGATEIFPLTLYHDPEVVAAIRAETGYAGIFETDVLKKSGYAALTVDAVAARAGVSKATIYRRFATKQEMTFAVVVHGLDEAPSADTGSLEGDLAALIERIGEQLRHRHAARPRDRPG